MRMPGFTADAADYRTSKQYVMAAATGYAYTGILPQATCGSCICDPGQCCVEWIFGGCDCRPC
jgi:hypothetical protein